MTDLSIEVNKISKKYVLRSSPLYGTLRDSFSLFFSGQKNVQKKSGKVFWALKDVSFKVSKGEVLGIIGRNGAGKSTLLKILSRITPPTSGTATLNGRVGSLLEVGTGFHQELTGRENVFLNGAILGMKQREIKKKLDEIIDFSGVEEFLDIPVKFYSSGMTTRLAFSVAAFLEPEILLVDEVLAVGDTEFQKKCLGKMDEVVKSEGRTILFVSHNMSAIEKLCPKTMLLSGGSIKYLGDTDKAISMYVSGRKHESKSIVYKREDLPAQIASVTLINQLRPDGSLDLGEKLDFSVKLRIRKTGLKVYCGFNIYNEADERIIFWRDIELNQELQKARSKGAYEYNLSIPPHSLAPGEYHLEILLVDIAGNRVIHQPSKEIFFTVTDNFSSRSRLMLPWRGLTSIPLGLSIKLLKNEEN